MILVGVCLIYGGVEERNITRGDAMQASLPLGRLWRVCMHA